MRAALPGYTSMVVGCGLGQDESTFAFLNELLLGDDASSIPASSMPTRSMDWPPSKTGRIA